MCRTTRSGKVRSAKAMNALGNDCESELRKADVDPGRRSGAAAKLAASSYHRRYAGGYHAAFGSRRECIGNLRERPGNIAPPCPCFAILPKHFPRRRRCLCPHASAGGRQFPNGDYRHVRINRAGTGRLPKSQLAGLARVGNQMTPHQDFTCRSSSFVRREFRVSTGALCASVLSRARL